MWTSGWHQPHSEPVHDWARLHNVRENRRSKYHICEDEYKGNIMILFKCKFLSFLLNWVKKNFLDYFVNLLTYCMSLSTIMPSTEEIGCANHFNEKNKLLYKTFTIFANWRPQTFFHWRAKFSRGGGKNLLLAKTTTKKSKYVLFLAGQGARSPLAHPLRMPLDADQSPNLIY